MGQVGQYKKMSIVSSDNKNQMTDAQKKELMQAVFDKLEKHARLSKLERNLGLTETHLHGWLDAWEGPQIDQSLAQPGQTPFFNHYMMQQNR